MPTNKNNYTFTKKEIDLMRGWFNAIQDLNPDYLEDKDFILAKELYRASDLRTPTTILEKVSSVGISDEEVEFVRLVDKVEQIKNSDVIDWEFKYDIIFDNSRKINKLAEQIGISFNYYDPDTTSKEDVLAYLEAITEARDKLINLHA